MGIWGHKKGQGATEYLVLLAVVLVVAMVAIALLGFFPGMATDAKKTQSDAYWRSDARPFAVVEHAQTGSALYLVVLNVEGEQRTLTNLSVAGTGGLGYMNETAIFFSAGDKKAVMINMTGFECPRAGDSYEYQLNFSYESPTIQGQKQYGSKPMIGKCS